MWHYRGQTENRLCQKQKDLSHVCRPCTRWPRTTVPLKHTYSSMWCQFVSDAARNVPHRSFFFMSKSTMRFRSTWNPLKASSKNPKRSLVATKLWKCISSTQKCARLHPHAQTQCKIFCPQVKSGKGKADLHDNGLLNNYVCHLQASIICVWELPWSPRKVSEDHIGFWMPHIHMSCHAATGADIFDCFKAG